MKLPTGLRMTAMTAVFMTLPLYSYAQGVEIRANTMEHQLLINGYGELNDTISEQTKLLAKTAAIQTVIAGEFNQMKKWERKKNDYLKQVRGYAEALKAGSNIYMQAMQTLRNLHLVKKGVTNNTEGVFASLSMNNLYAETAVEFMKTFRVLKYMVTKGGCDGMLNGAERTQVMWGLVDELDRLNEKLKSLAYSIAYYNMRNVWNAYTAGMTDQSHAQIAVQSLQDWKQCNNALMNLYFK